MNLANLNELLGPTLPACPLEPVLLNELDCGNYVRRTIEYAVEKDERIKAFLLVPKNITDRAPAIFAHHQHNGEFELGKSEIVGLIGDPNQAYGIELAERGYVVIAPDAIAFEERNWSKSPGYAEYHELAIRLVRGETLLRKILHDVSVAINYLFTLSEIDPNRIGFVGHSYGGRTAIWAPAVDPRIKASVSNCGCVNYKDSVSQDVGIQVEYCLPGLLKLGDVEDVVCLVAPRALLLQAAREGQMGEGRPSDIRLCRIHIPQGAIGIEDMARWPCFHERDARDCVCLFKPSSGTYDGDFREVNHVSAGTTLAASPTG